MRMKDLSYLDSFNPKIIREARRIIKRGITLEDIDLYLKNGRAAYFLRPINPDLKRSRRIPKEFRVRTFKNVKWGQRTP